MVLQALKLQCNAMKLTLQQWIYNEAIDMESLQKAGTFRNALLRKIDEYLSAKFAEIIAYVNRYNNLLILTEPENSALAPLWFEIFSSKILRLCTIFNVSSSPTSEVSSVQMMKNQYFTCRFPFSWAIFAVIEATVQNSGMT